MARNNRIWIELDKPRDAAHAQEMCELANQMLARLGVSHGRRFFWSERESCYCYGEGMGYTTLSDRGEWFNLDYLGRD